MKLIKRTTKNRDKVHFDNKFATNGLILCLVTNLNFTLTFQYRNLVCVSKTENGINNGCYCS